MGEVMLDRNGLKADLGGILVADRSQPVEHRNRVARTPHVGQSGPDPGGRIARDVVQFGPAVGAGVARDRDQIDVRQAQAVVGQEPADRLARKRRAVLDPLAQPLFGDRPNQLAIDQQACRRIGVEGVEAQNGGHGDGS